MAFAEQLLRSVQLQQLAALDLSQCSGCYRVFQSRALLDEHKARECTAVPPQPASHSVFPHLVMGKPGGSGSQSQSKDLSPVEKALEELHEMVGSPDESSSDENRCDDVGTNTLDDDEITGNCGPSERSDVVDLSTGEDNEGTCNENLLGKKEPYRSQAFRFMPLQSEENIKPPDISNDDSDIPSYVDSVTSNLFSSYDEWTRKKLRNLAYQKAKENVAKIVALNRSSMPEITPKEEPDRTPEKTSDETEPRAPKKATRERLKGVVQCRYCDKIFERFRIMMHIRNAHKLEFVCFNCQESTTSLQGLAEHMRKVHANEKSPDKYLSCQFCGAKIKNCSGGRGHLVRHIRQVHKIEYTINDLRRHYLMSGSQEGAEYTKKRYSDFNADNFLRKRRKTIGGFGANGSFVSSFLSSGLAAKLALRPAPEPEEPSDDQPLDFSLPKSSAVSQNCVGSGDLIVKPPAPCEVFPNISVTSASHDCSVSVNMHQAPLVSSSVNVSVSDGLYDYVAHVLDCDYCGVLFPSTALGLVDFEQHLLAEHEGGIVCKGCFSLLPSKDDMLSHEENCSEAQDFYHDIIKSLAEPD